MKFLREMKKVASKKSFDIEKMYRKIMPTYYDENNENEQLDEQDDNITAENADINTIGEKVPSVDTNSSLLKNKELEQFVSRDEKAILYNITEKLVLEKLDAVMDKMNCCKCDRCKMDIMSLALNSLEPHYVVKPREVVQNIEFDQEFSQKVTSAVLKSALTVRKKPRH